MPWLPRSFFREIEEGMTDYIRQMFANRRPAFVTGRRTGKTQAVQQFMEEHVNHNARVLRDIDDQLAVICSANGIEIEETTTLGGKLSLVARRLDEWDSHIASLTHNLAIRERVAEDAVAEARRQQQRADDYRDEISNLECEVDRLRSEARRFYKADGTYEVLASPSEVIARRMEAAEEIDRLKDEVRRQDGVIGGLHGSIAMEQQRAERLRKEVVDAEETNREWEHIISKMNEQMDRTLRKINHHPGQHVSYLDLLDWLCQRAEYLTTRSDGLEADYREAVEDADRLRVRVERIRSNLIALLGETNARFEGNYHDTEKLTEMLGREIISYRETANAAAHKRDEALANLDKAEEELDRCVTANMEMRETLDQLNEQLTGRGYTIRDLLADKAWARRIQTAAEFTIEVLTFTAYGFKDNPVLARIADDLKNAISNKHPE